MENRRYTRLPLEVVVQLQLPDDSHYYGETGDLSFDGAFIAMTPPAGLQVGVGCWLELLIKFEEGWVRTALKSSVAHIRADGVGVHFEEAAMHNHEAFLRLLLEGSDDIDRLLEELGRQPHGHFRFRP